VKEKTQNGGPDQDALCEPWYVSVPEMPSFFKKKLEKICSYCHCKGDILWRNLYRPEQHFDACFRYVDDEHPNDDNRCFLKRESASLSMSFAYLSLLVYTLRVPFIAELKVAFSMVHHIRAEPDKWIQTTDTSGNNQEHMFAFITGMKSQHIGQLLTDLINRWQDIAKDHLTTSAGMTPRLFVAAVISQYGSIIAPSIIEAVDMLKQSDMDLKSSIEKLGNKTREPPEAITKHISSLNQKLIDMNIKLSGTRSTMHYLGQSADVLVNSIIPFETYVKSRLSDWGPKHSKAYSKALRTAYNQLDNSRERQRDNDKLVMVRKSMLQYKTDIKSLQQHIDINVGMVRHSICSFATQSDRLPNPYFAGTKCNCRERQVNPA
jgi:hypothetical protein